MPEHRSSRQIWRPRYRQRLSGDTRHGGPGTTPEHHAVRWPYHPCSASGSSDDWGNCTYLDYPEFRDLSTPVDGSRGIPPVFPRNHPPVAIAGGTWIPASCSLNNPARLLVQVRRLGAFPLQGSGFSQATSSCMVGITPWANGPGERRPVVNAGVRRQQRFSGDTVLRRNCNDLTGQRPGAALATSRQPPLQYRSPRPGRSCTWSALRL